ncbi:alpha/beta fold hydrolase [Natronorubrum bangense]|uniref:Alpha/beta hydrolase fold protein n=2 Tax=Natronorubrum bangense TaxID=61858 RepID=L9W4B7_9EURY|nr:alpha/beta hydrolase [Natronorubrum bangense]ELY44177.1 alpha/beta hydrolase fold protein [Natronorubrum bangense JCM 10635]QCC55669.1 alpha/beta hydrolase [Natronorubrum bangense]
MESRSAERLETDARLLPTSGPASTVRRVNGVRLHTVEAGAEDAPLVVLLHGFPEFWYSWRHQIDPLVEAGYRVLVPDQRGYNLSDKPTGVRSYRIRNCSRDITALIASAGYEQAHVVGHDWGGMVAWDLARRQPSVVDRLGIINAPHPDVYRRHLLSSPAQLRRSWYVFCFQLPWLPERLCRMRDFRLLERALSETAAPETFLDDELARYREAWHKAGALTGMLNWYRAAARYPPTLSRERVEAPTMIVWGEDDAALTTELAVDSDQCCATSRLELLPETSHWVQHERPEQLSELLLEWLSATN